MTTISWQDALQGVTPTTGGVGLPPATYRFRPVGGEGKNNKNGNPSLTLQLEVISGPLAGRKHTHPENLPTGSTDQDKQRMGYFLGMCQAFGITGEMLGQWFGGQPITAESLDYLVKAIVQSGRQVKATLRTRKNDDTWTDAGGWMPDDGIEPEPPKQAQPSAAGPGSFGPPQTPNGFAGGPPQTAPAGLPQGGFPQTQVQAPAAQQGNGLPLGGFPGSAGPQGQPNTGPAWATQQPMQGQAPQQMPPGPGQAAPAAQPQAAGMNQFTQPAQGQFPGQQFPGQVDPASFPPQNQQQAAPQQAAPQQGFNPAQLVQNAPGQQAPGASQQGFQPPAGLPGGTPGQQQVPPGGFAPAGGPPQATI